MKHQKLFYTILILCLLYDSVILPLMRASAADVTAGQNNWWKPPYIRWSLLHMDKIGQTNAVHRSEGKPMQLPYKQTALETISVLDEHGQTVSLRSLLTRHDTDAFLVLHRGYIVYESYFNGMKPTNRHATASLSKVFTGVLIGLLAYEKKIQLSEQASAYIPELTHTPFGQATVQQLLDMRVQANYQTHGFRDSYLSNQDAQLYLASGLLPRADRGPDTIYGLLQEAQADKKPGDVFQYNNGSSEALGWIVRRITGMSLAQAVSSRIWSKIGAEEDAYYICDTTGVEEASAGLHTTLRDMGRFGLLLMNGGTIDGRRIIPASVIQDIRSKTGTYHNQWWITDHGFEVSGSYGQRLYINPKEQVVIVHFSSNIHHRKAIKALYSDAYEAIIRHLNKK